MKRQLLLLLALCLTLVANAQVVQGKKVPQLNVTQRGEILTGGNELAKGQLIYNTETNCLEYWNGDVWVSMCGKVTPYIEPVLPPKDETGQYRLNGKACYDVAVTDFPVGECMPLASRVNDFAGGFTFNYTFSGSAAYNITDYYAVGDGKNLVNLSRAGDIITATFVGNARDLATNTTKALTLIVTFDDNHGDPKYISIDISVRDCACGCSVGKEGGGFITFMCYNLGAATTVQSMTAVQQAANTMANNQGDMYQWGRCADGHQLRISSTVAGPITTFDANGQPTGTNKGKFITGGGDWRSPRNDALWGATKTANDPCPDGWRVPTQAEWGSIFRGGTTDGDSGTATANTWTWNNSGTYGYLIKHSSSDQATLFLPAVGYRESYGGNIYALGINGQYWSSTVNGTKSYYMFFNNKSVNPSNSADDYPRGNGHSVRCVADR